MAFITPAVFAQRIPGLRASLMAYACRTRPCQPEDAEDLVAEAVRLALLTLGCYDPDRAELLAWMFGILKIVILRDREKVFTLPATVPLSCALDIPALPDLPLRDSVQPDIDLLPIHLFFVVEDHLAGYSQREMAERWGISKGTVGNRMAEAEVLLRCEFTDFVDRSGADVRWGCTIYHKPAGLSQRWMHRHPPDKVWRFFYYEGKRRDRSKLQMRTAVQK